MAEKKVTIADRFLPRHDSAARDALRDFYLQFMGAEVESASTAGEGDEKGQEEIGDVDVENDEEEEEAVGQPTCVRNVVMVSQLEPAVDGERMGEVDDKEEKAAVILRTFSEEGSEMSNFETVEECDRMRGVEFKEKVEMKPTYSEESMLSDSETLEDDRGSESQFLVKEENHYEAIVLEQVDLGVWYLDQYENSDDDVAGSLDTSESESTAGPSADSADLPINVKQCSVQIPRLDTL